MNIVPMRDLKNTTKIEALCKETKEAVFVTKNGYGALVVMDMDLYEELLQQAYEAKLINAALKDVEEGRVRDAHEAMKEIKAKYGFASKK